MKLYFAHGCFCLIPGGQRGAGEGWGRQREAQVCGGSGGWWGGHWHGRQWAGALGGGSRTFLGVSSQAGGAVNNQQARAAPPLGWHPEPGLMWGLPRHLALRPPLARGSHVGHAQHVACTTPCEARVAGTGWHGTFGSTRLLPALRTPPPPPETQLRVRGPSGAGNRGRGGGWSYSPPRGNPACVSRGWTGWLEWRSGVGSGEWKK